jgi:Flp pilus assembly protein TadD
MRRNRPEQQADDVGTPEELLLRRAKRHARRGEGRKAMLAVKEACFLAPKDARLWALYAYHCWNQRRTEEAADAMRQAIFLRERARDERRADVLRRLLEKIEQGVLPRAA